MFTTDNDATIDDPSHLSIRQRLRFLAKDSIIYGGASALNKAFALITFPLLARHFSVSDYGLIDFFTLIAGLLVNLFIFGQDSAVARFIYEYKDTAKRCQLISQSLLFQIGCLLIALPVLLSFADKLSHHLVDGRYTESLLKLILVQVPFLVISNFSQNLLKWTFSRTRFLFVSLGTVVMNMALLLVAVLVFHIGITGVFLVGLLVQVTFGLVSLYFVRQWLVWPENLSILRKMLPFALPYGAICCISAFVPALERSLVNAVIGSQELGLYAAGSKIAMLVSVVIMAFQTAWGPFSLAIYQEPDAAKTYNWVLKLFSVGASVAVLLLSAMGEGVIRILASERYSGAASVVFPLAMGLVIQATSWITEVGIAFSKKSHLNLYSYTIYLLVTGLAIVLFAKIFGLVGVAFGVMIGHCAKAVAASWLAQRVHPLPWQYRPAFLLMMCTVLFGLTAMWFRSRYDYNSTVLLYVIESVIIMFIAWNYTISSHERMSVINYIQKIRG